MVASKVYKYKKEKKKGERGGGVRWVVMLHGSR